jgi:hypothetical protein
MNLNLSIKILCAKLKMTILSLAIVSAFIFSLPSCDSMDSVYKDFIKDGEIIYPGKADSVLTYPGNYRIKLSWLLMTDPTIASSKIYWNNYTDSTEIAFQRTKGIDTVDVILNDLDERIYTFIIYNFDSYGNKSVPTEISGPVYGENYRKSLALRGILNFGYDDGNLLIDWAETEATSLGDEFVYNDNAGSSHSVFVPVDEFQTVIDDFVPGTEFKYRSFYIPDTLAIDTFATDYDEFTLNLLKKETEVNRSGFSLYELPGDYAVPHGSSLVINNIWKNSSAVESNSYISKVDGHVLPQWFTIDMGDELELTKLKLFQRGPSRFYKEANLKEFEIWGSLDPDPDYNPDDHGGDFGDSWTLLQSCTVIKPSGSEYGTNTDEDVAAAQAGHEFEIQNLQKSRYIRIRVVDNWGDNYNYVNIAAFRFWANQDIIERVD